MFRRQKKCISGLLTVWLAGMPGPVLPACGGVRRRRAVSSLPAPAQPVCQLAGAAALRQLTTQLGKGGRGAGSGVFRGHVSSPGLPGWVGEGVG